MFSTEIKAMSIQKFNRFDMARRENGCVTVSIFSILYFFNGKRD